MNKNAIMWGYGAQAIIALAILVIATTIGVSLYGGVSDLSDPIRDSVFNQSNNSFQIVNESEYLTDDDGVALASFNALIEATNALAEGKTISKDGDRNQTIVQIGGQDHILIDANIILYADFEVTVRYNERGRTSNMPTQARSTKKTIQETITVSDILSENKLRGNSLFVQLGDLTQYPQVQSVVFPSDRTYEDSRVTAVEKLYNFELQGVYEPVDSNQGNQKTRSVNTGDKLTNSDLFYSFTNPAYSNQDELFSGRELRGIDVSKGETCENSVNNLRIPGLDIFYCGKGEDFVKFDLQTTNQNTVERYIGVTDEKVLRYPGLGHILFESLTWGEIDEAQILRAKLSCENGKFIDGVCVECEKDQCIIKGFELPQDVTLETAPGRIAGYGDPKYLIYYQQFPPGEESAWQYNDVASLSQAAMEGAFYGALVPVGGQILKIGGRLAVSANKIIMRSVNPLRAVKDVAYYSRVAVQKIFRNGKISKAAVEKTSKQGAQTLEIVDDPAFDKILARAKSITPESDNLALTMKNQIPLSDAPSVNQINNAFDSVASEVSQRSIFQKMMRSPAFVSGTSIRYGTAILFYIGLMYEDSIIQKFHPVGVNALAIRQPMFENHISLPDGFLAKQLSDSVKQFTLILDKHKPDGKDRERLYFASPCKTDIIIKKVSCTCAAELTTAEEIREGENAGELDALYHLRRQAPNTPYYIPQTGLIDDNQTFQKEFATFRGHDLRIQQDAQKSFVVSSGGDDSQAISYCTENGWFKRTFSTETNVQSQCLLYSLDKSAYTDYNDGNNFCHEKSSTTKQIATVGLYAVATVVDVAVTGVVTVKTAGLGSYAAYAVTSMVTSTVTNVIVQKIASDFMWPRGD